MPTSLKQLVKKRVLVDTIRSVQTPGKYKVLVVDPQSLRLLNQTCDMNEITEANILLIEEIGQKRQAYPDKEAIYFITPSFAVINALIRDFEGPKVMYAGAHIFCTAALADPLFETLKNSGASRYIKALKELNVDFTPFESQVFHLTESKAFTSLYGAPDLAQLDKQLDAVASQMISVLHTLGDAPFIRFWDPTGKRASLAARMAHKIQRAIDRYKELEPDWPPASPFPPAQLIVLDRSTDVYSALIHSLTYQAAAHDFLMVEGVKVTYVLFMGGALRKYYRLSNSSADTQMDNAGSATLDETDELFVQIRHAFLADASTTISQTINKLVAENPALSGWSNATGVKAIEEMKKQLMNAPRVAAAMEKALLHANIWDEINQAINQRNLTPLAELEQTVATGEQTDGKPIKSKDLTPEITKLLEDVNIPTTDKLRALLTFLMGVPDVDAQQLVESARLAEAAASIRGMEFVGATPVEKKTPRWRYTDAGRKHEHQKRKKGKDEEVDEAYDLHRYVPVVKYILEDAARGELDPTLFPSVIDAPSETANGPTGVVWAEEGKRGAGTVYKFTSGFKPSWGKRKPVQGGQTEDVDLRVNGPRIIVVFVGGMSFAEVRAAYEVTHALKRDVIIGSSHLLTPTQFVEGLRELGESDYQPLSLPPIFNYTGRTPSTTSLTATTPVSSPPAINPAHPQRTPQYTAPSSAPEDGTYTPAPPGGRRSSSSTSLLSEAGNAASPGLGPRPALPKRESSAALQAMPPGMAKPASGVVARESVAESREGGAGSVRQSIVGGPGGAAYAQAELPAHPSLPTSSAPAGPAKVHGFPERLSIANRPNGEAADTGSPVTDSYFPATTPPVSRPSRTSGGLRIVNEETAEQQVGTGSTAGHQPQYGQQPSVSVSGDATATSGIPQRHRPSLPPSPGTDVSPGSPSNFSQASSADLSAPKRPSLFTRPKPGSPARPRPQSDVGFETPTSDPGRPVSPAQSTASADSAPAASGLSQSPPGRGRPVSRPGSQQQTGPGPRLDAAEGGSLRPARQVFTAAHYRQPSPNPPVSRLSQSSSPPPASTQPQQQQQVPMSSQVYQPTATQVSPPAAPLHSHSYPPPQTFQPASSGQGYQQANPAPAASAGHSYHQYQAPASTQSTKPPPASSAYETSASAYEASATSAYQPSAGSTHQPSASAAYQQSASADGYQPSYKPSASSQVYQQQSASTGWQPPVAVATYRPPVTTAAYQTPAASSRPYSTATPPPQSHAYAPAGAAGGQVYRPSSSQQAYHGSAQGYPASTQAYQPQPAPSYHPPASTQAYQQVPTSTQNYHPAERLQSYSPPSASQSYRPPPSSQGYQAAAASVYQHPPPPSQSYQPRPGSPPHVYAQVPAQTYRPASAAAAQGYVQQAYAQQSTAPPPSSYHPAAAPTYQPRPAPQPHPSSQAQQYQQYRPAYAPQPLPPSSYYRPAASQGPPPVQQQAYAQYAVYQDQYAPSASVPRPPGHVYAQQQQQPYSPQLRPRPTPPPPQQQQYTQAPLPGQYGYGAQGYYRR
ncbi:Syntaxin-binding protein 2 [Borealophlyctis nickersoniae]|nr:Syntaxin-binding protein 2 [Borealophlyctis nickersoniae]